MRPAHDRMPVILDPQHYAEWLNPSLTDPTLFVDWLRPYPADSMTAYPVSPLVHNARPEGPERRFLAGLKPKRHFPRQRAGALFDGLPSSG